MHPQIQKLLHCVELEEKEQANRYKLDQLHTLKQLLPRSVSPPLAGDAAVA
jgi:hypothetical protein